MWLFRFMSLNCSWSLLWRTQVLLYEWLHCLNQSSRLVQPDVIKKSHGKGTKTHTKICFRQTKDKLQTNNQAILVCMLLSLNNFLFFSFITELQPRYQTCDSGRLASVYERETTTDSCPSTSPAHYRVSANIPGPTLKTCQSRRR